MPLNPDTIHIWREPDGDYHIEWQTSEPETRVSVEPLADPALATAHYPEDTPGRARVTGLPHQQRHFFRLRDQHGTEATSTERRFGMEGAPNFRDFGGYPTSDGRRVKWGYLFRSGQLSRLSDRDLQLLDNLQLDLVCDFRRLDEQDRDPSRLPAGRTPRVIPLPITPGSNSAFFEQHGEQDISGRQAMFDFMVDINRDLAEEQQDTYTRMFAEILDQADARFLLHCAAGKDRTGFGTALVLLALDVAEDLVMRDYLLTRQFFSPQRELDRLREKYGLEDMPAESILPMLEVHAAYLERALAAIKSGYGSVENYLAVLGVGPAEREELRRRYLEPA